MTDMFLQLTRELVDIESVTNYEAPVGEFLFRRFRGSAAAFRVTVERCPVKADRFNVFAQWGEPLVTLSTHMDTVPPFFRLAKMPISSGDVAPRMPRASLPP